ncbi:MAG: hypothetical protein PHI29_00985 [Gallionella sp.]|nr:hypothetical protein [Gallionella sp.]
MQASKGLWVAVLACVALAACASSMIEVRKGSERVSLAEANQIGACQSKGKTTVSALAKVGPVVRDAVDVEANLYQLAVNDAIEVGADTIVKGDSAALGNRTYALYKCRP